MARNRSSQRGVIRMASSAILAALGALMIITGCSAEQGADTREHLGSVGQALACSAANPCPPDNPCANFKCNLLAGQCDINVIGQDGSQCKDPQSGNLGTCTSFPLIQQTQIPICCLGCIERVAGGYACHKGIDVGFCGLDGGDCKNCDSANACSKDSCQKGQCVNDLVPDKEACLDNSGTCWKNACCRGCLDQNEVCQPGGAVTSCGKSSVNGLVGCADCTDGQVCTTDACNVKGNCVNTPVANDTPCLDANKCDGAESCQAGVCTDQVGFMCPSDGNACHVPNCGANGCGQQLLNNTTCPDANLCNGTEKCNNGVCNIPGTPVNCNDNNPCTSDDCDPQTGKCLNTPVAAGELCENGDVCDGIGVCNDVAKCVVQPAQPCDNSDPCKIFQCDKLKGCVVTSFTTAACNDGDPCTTVDKCDGAGVCKGGTPQKCDDGNECTTDSCVPFQGCKAVAGNEGAVCNDGNDCSTGDKCVAGKCLASGGKTCADDTNPCTTASCDPANQICGQTNDNTAKCQTDKCHQFTQCLNGTCPVGAPIDCADTNPCTKDDCDPATGCTHDPDDAATCSDSNLCTEGDACKSGKCVATAVVCEAVDDCHKVGTCNPQSSFCDAPRADVGTACNQDTGTCNDKGKCIPNPTTGEGGAGGAGGADGTGGELATAGTGGTGGTPVAEGGKPTTVGMGGEGNEPVTGGEPGTPSGGKGGVAAGGKTGTTNEGGDAEVPSHVFVRDPGGCACSVPVSSGSNGLWGLAGLALAAAGLRRRQARGSRRFTATS